MSFFKPSSTFFSLNQYRKDKRDKIVTLLQKLSNIITFNDENSHNFLADEMILFSRSLDFLKDKRLIDSANNVFNSNEIEYRDFSAIIWRKHILTWAGEHCKKLEGDFCDFGCYDGSGSQFINEYCELNKNNKIFYIYDTFTAPPNSHPFPKHSDSLYDDVVKKFSKENNIRVIKGTLPKSMEGNLPNKIAFAHVDLNDVKSELGVLDKILKKMSKGGIIILDDYGWSQYKEQLRVEKKFFNDNNLKVLELPTGQGMVLIG